MFTRSRCQSYDVLEFEEGSFTDLESAKRARSLDSGLDNLKQNDMESSATALLKDEKDFIIAELKRDCEEKDAEISRLKTVENNYSQAKQQLKDTKWMLKVKDEELKNVRSDCANNYNQRLEELVVRLKEKEFNLTSALDEKQDLLSTVNDYSQRIDELAEQVEYFQKENNAKNEEISYLEKHLKEMKDEDKSRRLSSVISPIPVIIKSIQTEEDILDDNKELLKKIRVLEEEIDVLKDERSKLHEVVIQKDNNLQENDRERNLLEKHLQKEKKNVAELVCLLEGLSTNSDNLPTGQVYHTTNAPLDSYLLKRTTSNDSVQEMDEIQSDHEVLTARSDVSEPSLNTSLREQMNHTVRNYEDQIKQLQSLYDNDVYTLEKEKGELVTKLEKLKKQIRTSDSSDMNMEDLEKRYEETFYNAEKEHSEALQQTRKEAKDNMATLRLENEKLNKLLHATEEKYLEIIQNMREEFFSMSSHEASFKVQDVIEAQQGIVTQMKDGLQSELDKINQTYNEELLQIEDNIQHTQDVKIDLEESFSNQMVNMQVNQSQLEVQITALEDELSSTQNEYNFLKTRYDDVLKKLDELQYENTRLNQILKDREQHLKTSPSESAAVETHHTQDLEADISISSNDVEIASEKYVNIDYTRTEKEEVPAENNENEHTLQEQLKLLRENLNDAKNDVNSLKEEKVKFEVLSDNLNLELNSLKSQLQNQSVFDMSRSALPNGSAMRFLEASIHDLLSASGYQLNDTELADESMLPSQYLHKNELEDSSEDDGLMQENTLFIDSMTTEDDVVDNVSIPMGPSYMETPERNEEAQRLFQKIKYIVDTTRDEQNIIYNQLKFLKERFSRLSLATETEDIKDILNATMMEWKDLEEGLLNQDAECSEEQETANTFEHIQGSLMELAEQMYNANKSQTELVGKTINTTTQEQQNVSTQSEEQLTDSAPIIADLQAKLVSLQAIYDGFQISYEENFEVMKQQMELSNKESLKLLREELEKDHEEMLQMLQNSLTAAHLEKILSLTTAHDQEIATLEEQTIELIEIAKTESSSKEEDVVRLTEENNTLKQSGQDLLEEKQNLESQVASRKKELIDRDVVIAQLNDIVEENCKKVIVLENKLDELQDSDHAKEINTLDRSYEENSEYLNEMFVQNSIQQVFITELENTNIRTKEPSQAGDAELQEAHQNPNEQSGSLLTAAVEDDLRLKNKELEDRLKNQMGDADISIQEKTETIEHLNRTLEEKENKIQTISKQVNDLVDRNTELENEWSQRESDTELLKVKSGEFESLNKMYKECAQKLEETEAQYQSLQMRNDELENLFRQKVNNLEMIVKEKNDILSKSFEEHVNKLKEAGTGYENLHQRNQELESQFTLKETELSSLKEQFNDSMNRTFEEHTHKLEETETRCQDLQKKNTELEKLIAKQMGDFDQSSMERLEEMEVLNQTIEDNVDEMDRMRSENQSLLNRTAELEENLSKNIEVLRLREARIEELNTSQDKLLNHYKEKNEALKSLVDEKEMYILENVQNHQEDLAKYRKDMEELNNLVKEYEVECNRLNTSLEQAEIEQSDMEKSQLYEDDIGKLVAQYEKKLQNETGQPSTMWDRVDQDENDGEPERLASINDQELQDLQETSIEVIDDEVEDSSLPISENLQSLQKVFSVYHENEMEQLKRSSFSWLKRKLTERDQKIANLEETWQQKNFQDLAALHTSLLVKFECERQLDKKVDQLAETSTQSALLKSVRNVGISCQSESSKTNGYFDKLVAPTTRSVIVAENIPDDVALSTQPIEEAIISRENAQPMQPVSDSLTSTDAHTQSLELIDEPTVVAENVANDHTLPDALSNPDSANKTEESMQPINKSTIFKGQIAENVIPSDTQTHVSEKEALQKEISRLQSIVETITAREEDLHAQLLDLQRSKSPSKHRVTIVPTSEDVSTQIAAAKTDMNKQFQNLMNEFTMGHYQEVERLKTEYLNENEEHAKEMSILADEHQKELQDSETKLRNLQTQFEEDKKELNERHQDEIEKLKEAQCIAVESPDDNLREKNQIIQTLQEEIAQLQEAHQNEIGNLKESQDIALEKALESSDHIIQNLQEDIIKFQKKHESEIEDQQESQIAALEKALESSGKSTQFTQDLKEEIAKLKEEHEKEIGDLKESHRIALEKASHSSGENAQVIQDLQDEIGHFQLQHDIDKGNEREHVKQLHESSNQIEKLKHAFNNEFELLMEEHSKELAALRQEKKKEKEIISKLANEELSLLKAAHQDELSALRLQHDAEIESTELEHEKELVKEKKVEASEVQAISQRKEIEENKELIEVLPITIPKEMVKEDEITTSFHEFSETVPLLELPLDDDVDATPRESDSNYQPKPINKTLLQRLQENISKMETDGVKQHREKDEIELLHNIMESVLDAEQLIDKTLNDVINAQAPEGRTIEEIGEIDTTNVEDELAPSNDNPDDLIDKNLLFSLRDSCRGLYAAIEHILAMFMNAIMEQKEIQKQYEALVSKYTGLTERASRGEQENAQLSADIEHLMTNQKAMEESLMEAQDIIDSHETNAKEKEVSDEGIEGLRKEVSELGVLNEELESELGQKKQQLLALKDEQDVCKTKYDIEIAALNSSVEELAERENDYMKLLTENENKINNLNEENQQLLQEKQKKDLKLADLKMRLEQAQYTHKENITKKMNESFELKEENESLWQDVENLKQTLDTISEEKKAYNNVLSKAGFSLQDIPKLVLENQQLTKHTVPQLHAQVQSFEQAIAELLEEKATLAASKTPIVETSRSAGDQQNETKLDGSFDDKRHHASNSNHSDDDSVASDATFNVDDVDNLATPISTPRFSLPTTPGGRSGVALEQMLCKLLEEQLKNDGNVTATPSNLINPKVLLGEIQSDANELLELVLNYPEFSEPLKLIQNFERQQAAWLEEKKSLLALVKSWENMVMKVKGEHDNDGDNEHTSTMKNHFRRGEIIDALKELFAEEEEVKQAEQHTMKLTRQTEIDVEEGLEDDNILQALSTDVMNESTAISELVNKDRDYLLEEIRNLHNTLSAQQEGRESVLQSNADLKKEIASLEENLQQWKAETPLNRQQNEELVAMTEAYQQAKNDCERLKLSLEARVREHQSLSKEVTASREMNNHLKSEMLKLRENSKVTQEQHDTFTKDLITKLEIQEEKLKYLENKLEILTSQNAALEQMLEKAREKENEKELDALKENEVLLESLKNEKEARNRTEKHLDDLTETLQNVENENTVKNKELELLSSENETLQMNYLGVEKELEIKKKDNGELLEAVEEVTEELKRVNGMKTRLQNSYDDMVSIHDQEKSEMESKLRGLEKEIKEKDLYANEEEVANLRNLITSLNNDIEECSQREGELLKENKALETSLGKLNENLQDEEQKQKYLEKKMKLLVDERDATQHLLELEKKKASELVEQQNSLLRDLKRTKQESKQAKFERQLMTKELEKANEIHEQEKENLQKLIIDVTENPRESLSSSYQQREVESLRTLLTKLNGEVEGYEQRERNWMEEKKKMNEEIRNLNEELKIAQEELLKLNKAISPSKQELTTGDHITVDGRKLIDAGWTIAKVQRLYLKYFRAESFRKALRYQKRYLTIRLKEVEEERDTRNQLYLSKPNRFRIAGWTIIAINRMRYLVRKYQRYLLKSSPSYSYKERPKGSSTLHTLPSAASNGVVHHRNLQGNSKTDSHSTDNTDLSAENLFQLKEPVIQNYEPMKPVHQLKQPIKSQGTKFHVSPEDHNKTKPMALQDLIDSPPGQMDVASKDFVPLQGKSERVKSRIKETPHLELSSNRFDTFSPENPSVSPRYSQGRSSVPKNDSRLGGQEYRKSARGFDSLRAYENLSTGYHQCHISEPLASPPPMSYPRPKSNVLRDDYIPTKLENTNNNDEDYLSSTSVEGRDSQKELKKYMHKLEELQRKLKSQRLSESSTSRKFKK